MTTVTDVAPTLEDAKSVRRLSLLERLEGLLGSVQSMGEESLEASIARAVDQAFASIASEFRR